MFQWLFSGERKNRQRIVDALYQDIVEAARRPVFYADWGVPDSPLGRYEMLSVHFFLFLHRIRGQKGALADVGQDITDHFFQDLDHSLREFGIGDSGVPKRMKKLARMFYGRVASYQQAIESDDRAALAGALTRNIMPEQAGWPWAAALADYMMEAGRALAEYPESEILLGRISYLPLVAEKE